MTVYALLDYDGYICKSYYAGLKEDKAEEILDMLVNSAIEKTAEYFDVDIADIQVIKAVSGHTFKKDIYPSYKAKRKKDENLGEFRDFVILSESLYSNEIRKVSMLEADDLLVILNSNLKDSIVFSDDKDLSYYSAAYCKLNLESEVQFNSIESLIEPYAQMIAGDSEDNIKGVPKIGMKKACNYIMSNNEISLNTVVKCYKEHDIDIDNCLRDVLLVAPIGSFCDTALCKDLSKDLIEGDIETESFNLKVYNLIFNQMKILNDTVKEVYN